jgi:hypothetical protein
VAGAKRQAESLRLLVAPFLLRRLKTDVTTTMAPTAAGGRTTRRRPFSSRQSGSGDAPQGSEEDDDDDDDADSGSGGGAFQRFGTNGAGSGAGGSAGGGSGGRRRSPPRCLAQLPPKTEQVLFCKLTSAQRRLYEEVLQSKEMAAVLDGRARSFRVITLLRKVWPLKGGGGGVPKPVPDCVAALALGLSLPFRKPLCRQAFVSSARTFIVLLLDRHTQSSATEPPPTPSVLCLRRPAYMCS